MVWVCFLFCWIFLYLNKVCGGARKTKCEEHWRTSSVGCSAQHREKVTVWAALPARKKGVGQHGGGRGGGGGGGKEMMCVDRTQGKQSVSSAS